MITEDYVNFETAKLLKEKGFDEPCYAYWCEDENRIRISRSPYAIQNITNPCFFGPAAPTLQMTMKWLREVHKLWCEISWEGTGLWCMHIFSLTDEEFIPGTIAHKIESYEEACEDAIKYCLEHLI